MTIRVMVADDRDSARRSLCRIVEAQPDMGVVGEAADGHAAVRTARSVRPEVSLVDIRMPGLDGLEVTRQLAAEQLRVVVVTSFDLDEYVYAALAGGACGFLLKRSRPALLAEAIRAAVAGESLISPAITVRLFQRLSEPSPAVGRNPLSVRETEVARLLAAGLSNADIAAELRVTVGTVKSHVANIQLKLGTANRVGIAAWAWRTGHARP